MRNYSLEGPERTLRSSVGGQLRINIYRAKLVIELSSENTFRAPEPF